MATVEKNKVLNQIIKDFKSDDLDTILKALKKVRDKGKTEVLEPLFNLFEETKDRKSTR